MKSDNTVFDPVELAALYAAGVLPPEEVAAIEARLEADEPALAEELASYEGVLLALVEGLDPVAPKSRSKGRLLQQVAALRSVAGGQPPRGDRWPGHGLEVLLLRTSFASWRQLDAPGVEERLLYQDRQRNVQAKLIRMSRGAKLPAHPHPGVEECFLLAGDIHTFGADLHAGDYMRAPAGSHHTPSSTDNGCVLLVWVTPDAEPLD